MALYPGYILALSPLFRDRAASLPLVAPSAPDPRISSLATVIAIVIVHLSRAKCIVPPDNVIFAAKGNFLQD